MFIPRLILSIGLFVFSLGVIFPVMAQSDVMFLDVESPDAASAEVGYPNVAYPEAPYPDIAPTSITSSPDAADLHQLKIMLNEAVASINEGDLSRLTEFLDEDVVVIFQNAEIIRGHEDLEDFFDKFINDDASILTAHTTSAEESAPAIIDGNTAIGYGVATDSFTFRGGKTIEVSSSWMTTLRKDNGEWRVVSLQFSSNIFDNPLLSAAKNLGYIFGLIGFALALFLVFLTRKFCKKKTA